MVFNKELIQLGDVVVLSNGSVYIYLNCPGTGYSSDKNILVRETSYFGKGLESFDDNLCFDSSIKIVDIRKPTRDPLIFLYEWRDIRSFNFQIYVRTSISRILDENFINISLYV